MSDIKTRSIKGIEQKMENMDTGSLRYHCLQSAKSFKTSWVDLGRALYSVYKDKLFREWGYGTFDIYTAKEIGIKRQTAVKLLKSYYFLEKEEPVYLEKGLSESENVAKVPSYEAVDLLRRAKAKKGLDKEDYTALKKEIFELNFQRKYSRVEKPGTFRNIRRTIARIKTILNERKNDGTKR